MYREPDYRAWKAMDDPAVYDEPVPLASTPQPDPTGDGPIVAEKVLADIQHRVDFGIKKYGTPLRANNGRDALADAYQEAIDLVMYLAQLLIEREGE